jgi:hypothetical protein
MQRIFGHRRETAAFPELDLSVDNYDEISRAPPEPGNGTSAKYPTPLHRRRRNGKKLQRCRRLAEIGLERHCRAMISL